MTERPQSDVTEESGLALALGRLAASPDDPAARLGFHAELIASELFLWLADLPDTAGQAAGAVAPQVFDLETGPTALAFDSEGALAGFAGAAAPYLALPGRVLVTMLAQAAPPLSLLVQDGVGRAELLDPDALAWLTQTLQAPAPQVDTDRIEAYLPPALPESDLALLVPVLERRLSHLPGLQAAVLVQARWAQGGGGHLLALSGLPEPAQAPVARAVAEALTLSGAGLARLDVVFPGPGRMRAITAAGLALNPARFAAPESAPAATAPPGSDPTRPPRLR